MRTVIAAAVLVLAIAAGAAQAQQPGAAVAPSAPRPPDGTYIYNWSGGGAVAGQSTVVIQTQGGHLSMRTDTNLSTVQLSGGTAVFGAARLELQSYAGYASANGLNNAIDLKLVNGAIVGSIKNQSVTNPVNVSQLASVPVIAVDDGTLGTFLMLPAQANVRGANSFQLIPIVSGIAGFVMFSTSSAGPYPYGVPTSDVVASFGNSTTLWYNPSTLVVDQFMRGSLVATLVSQR